MIDKLLSIVAPHNCVACAIEGSVLCRNCRLALRPAAAHCYKCQNVPGQQTCVPCSAYTPLQSVSAAASYKDQLAKRLLWQLKFERNRSAAIDIAQIISQEQIAWPPAPFLLVPAPTATIRVRERGYDQAILIAKQLSKITPGALYDDALVRLGTDRQRGKSRAERLSGQTRLFRVRNRARLHLPVVLVDDVVTTGATLEEAARTLEDAGARHITAVVFAQA